VSARTFEIAQLRAIGFGALPVVISVLAKALLLAVTGALLGAGIAWLLFNGHVTSWTLGGDARGAQTQSAVAMAVTPALIVLGIIWGCVIGLTRDPGRPAAGCPRPERGVRDLCCACRVPASS
jgi:putative ABC transport system permease protein